MDFNPLSMNKKFIHDEVEFNHMKFLITTVYGLHTIARRSSLWPTLNSLAGSIQIPWLLIGNYITILDIEDRGLRCPVQNNEVGDFAQFLEDNSLTELKWVGRKYTRTNGHIHSKLDRAIVNVEWMQIFPHLEAVVIEPGCSDHSPIDIYVGYS